MVASLNGRTSLAAGLSTCEKRELSGLETTAIRPDDLL